MIYRTYKSLFDATQATGRVVPTRLGPAKELLAQTLSVPMGSIVARPGLNRALGFVEGLMFLGGMFDPKAIRRVGRNVNMDLFTDQAAYGPRVGSQLADVVNELRDDPWSRRAEVVLARSPREGHMHGELPSERPCTTALQFMLRPHADTHEPLLHTIISMRSWDLWLGAPYDLIQFGVVALAVARCLDLPSGFVTVTAGSAHLYEKHWEYEVGPGVSAFQFAPGAPWSMLDLQAYARATIGSLVQGGDRWPNGVPPLFDCWTPLAAVD